MPDTIYVNGDVITMDDAKPEVEAVVVRKGHLLYAGDRARAMEYKRFRTRVVDLGGKALLPGFIDPHSHFLMAGMMSGIVSLSSPPIDDVETIDHIIARLRKAIADRKIKPGDMLLGSGFDESLLKEGRVPTREDLDKVSTEHLVYIIHQSGHKGVGNSAVLAKYGIDEDTPNPEGGVIGRFPRSRTPNGVLEETIHMKVVYGGMTRPKLGQVKQLLAKGAEIYAREGITTVQEGALGRQFVPLARLANTLGWLKQDVVGYCTIESLDDFQVIDKAKNLNRYRKRFKIGGAKFFLDGSPQAKTAWLSQPYHVPPEGESADYRGYPTHEDDGFVTRVFEECLKRDIQVITHTNGDQASEQLITCFEAAAKNTGFSGDVRPVMIHAQTVRDDQLDRMAKINMIPSFFQAHTFFWGDWHINSVLGRERAYRISPVRSAIERGVTYTLHQDTPVVPPQMIFTLWTAVNRKTRSGEVIGPDQRATIMEALKGITTNAAYQYFEEDEKGSITAGKRADLVILDRNPLKVEPDAIKDIRVLETIKDGGTIWNA